MRNLLRQIKKVTCILLLVSFLILKTHAQDSKEVKALFPGDIIPDIELNHAINYSDKKMRLSDFKGKLIILDFWSTGCIGCIQQFPKLDSLQKQFANKIQIILVNRESEDSTKRFFEKRKKIILPALPFITGDKVLKNLFPHISYPFHVWIDSSGIVQYTADGYNTNYTKIKLYLEGKDIGLEDKVNDIYLESFFDEKQYDLLEYYSYIARCKRKVHLEGAGKRPGFEKITYNCLPLIQLYILLYTKLTNDQYNFYRPARTIIECADSTKYFPPADVYMRLQWNEKYSYSYQLLLPVEKKSQKYQIMKVDLERVFKVKSNIEKRKVNCLVLVRTSVQDKLQTKGGLPRDNFYRASLKSIHIDSIRYYYNTSYATFSKRIGSLIESNFNLPFQDSTHYTGSIDIELNGDILDNKNISLLRGELKKYDLDLIVKECILDVLVLKETIE